jgi:hypothetical protein
MSPERLKIIKFVNAAADLAEGLTRNLKSKQRVVTDETVVALARFYSASKEMQDLLDLIERDNQEIN